MTHGVGGSNPSLAATLRKYIVKKEYADLWVEALRSGQYEQAQKQLRSIDNKFCCLGVLCELVGIRAHLEINQNRMSYYHYEGNSDFLPNSVKTTVGMASLNGGVIILSEGIVTNLADLNDDGKTFAEIADIIEQNWEKL